MSQNNATNRKLGLRRTLCFAAAAATTLVQNQQVNAFTQLDNHHHNHYLHHHSSSSRSTNINSSNMKQSSFDMSPTTIPLTDHLSQNNLIPLMGEAAVVANTFNAATANATDMAAMNLDLDVDANGDASSEYCFSNYYSKSKSGGGENTGSDADPLSMTASDEQQEFDIMIGRALDK